MARGRGGRKVWPYPVELEPPFTLFRPSAGPLGKTATHTIPEPRPVERPGRMVEFLAIRVSPEDEYSPARGKDFLLALTTARHVAYEVVGCEGHSQLQIALEPSDSDAVISQIRAHYPHANVKAGKDALDGVGPSSLLARNYRLRESHLFPIRADSKHDPYISLVGVLNAVPTGQVAIVQVLLAQVRHPWSRNILAVATDSWDPSRSAFEDLPDLPKLARSKVEHPLFAVSVRLGATSSILLDRLEASFLRLFDSPENGFVSTAPEYEPEALLGRYTNVPGMLLNAQELAAVAHLPDPTALGSGAVELARRTAPAPPGSGQPVVVLGTNGHRGEETTVGLTSDQLSRHCFISGFTGSGKSTLIKALLISIMQTGHGLAFVDYAGDTAEELLYLVPEHRAKDVLYFNPGDREYPPALNVLTGNRADNELIASEVMVAFKRLFTGASEFGPRMEWILRSAIRTLLASSTEKTLRDIPRFLADRSYRQHVLQSVPDVELKAFWQDHAAFPATAIDPILNRLSMFLDRPTVRNVVAQQNLIDLHEVMDHGRIMVCNLSKGLLGEEAAQVLGSLLLSKLQLAAMARASKPQSERKLFVIAIDEFANIAGPGQDTTSIRSLISESRKYAVAFCAATQHTAQLDRDVRSSIFGNVGTLVCLRSGIEDATLLQRELGVFTAEDLMNLETGQAIARFGQASSAFNVDISPAPRPEKSFKEQILKQSRGFYCRSRATVEHVLWQESQSKPASVTADHKVEAGQGSAKPAETPASQDSPKVPPRTQQTSDSSIGSRSGSNGRPPDAERPDRGRRGKKQPDGQNESQHRYLQNLIKQMAEANGFKATIEQTTSDGQGKVDVGIELNGIRIACEITVTTSVEHELTNIQKCLRAGYAKVVVSSPHKWTLQKVESYCLPHLEESARDRVLFLAPENLPAYLEAEAAGAAAKEARVKGYKVKVRYRPVSGEEREAKRQAVAQVMFEALRRLKGKNGT